MKPFGHFIYNYNQDLGFHHNIGDEIQTLAVLRLLGMSRHTTIPINRENMTAVESNTPINLVMNGWFLNSANWPPSEKIQPIFFGFHIGRRHQRLFLSETSINYFKKHEPIGCRDHGTKKLLESQGIRCFHSWCPTLTFPKRERQPKHGFTYIIVENKKLRRVIPKSIRRDAMLVYHNIRMPCNINADDKFDLTTRVYKTYKENATLIITDKIHCAMPAIAMGIPVVFITHKRSKRDYRIHIIDDLIGINYLRYGFLNRWYYRHKINWQPTAPNIESLKKEITAHFNHSIKTATI